MAQIRLTSVFLTGNNPIMVWLLSGGKKDAAIPREYRDGLTNGDANRLRKAIVNLMDIHPAETMMARKRIQDMMDRKKRIQEKMQKVPVNMPAPVEKRELAAV